MIRAHKIELKVNNVQAGHLSQCCGTARFAFNWALARWNSYYAAGLKVSTNQLDKDYNKCKKTLFPWAYNVTRSAGQNAIKSNLNNSFDRFFKKTSKYPKFKKKGVRDSFKINNDQFELIEKSIKLPKLGIVSMRERLRFEGKILSATISKDVDRWFVSIVVQMDDIPYIPKPVIGIDLGINTAIVTSDGQFVDSPKPLKKHKKKLSRSSRKFSKKSKGSKNRTKARTKLAKVHRRIRRIRNNWIQKTTTLLSKNHVVLEDLAVSNMMKNHCLAKAISDMGWYEIYRQLNYKTTVVKIGRFVPSSKTCLDCGIIQNMPLSERIFRCECGYECDRDLNASRIIHTLGLREFQACGQTSSVVILYELRETSLDEAGTKHQIINALSKI